MNTKPLEKIYPQIHSILNGGDILFIIPPFAVRDYSILGPHIPHALATERGFKAEILYANILLASIIGGDLYDRLSKVAYDLRGMMLGERLFARSAHGLPSFGGELPHTDSFDMSRLPPLEEICTAFIDELVRTIAGMDYKIVGCTSTLEQNNSSVALLKGIKEHCPRTVTIMGGGNCEGDMAEGIVSLGNDIDYVFSGESETAFIQFLSDFRNKCLPNKRILRGPLLENLDSIPLADYSSYFEQTRLFMEGNLPSQMVVSYETSRGCWRAGKEKCLFCGVISNHYFRQKKEETVLSDLEKISVSYPVTNLLMTDNIVPHSYYKKLLDGLAGIEGIPPIWYQENTNSKLKDLVNLKKAHIKSLLLGVEALSTGLLKSMNKRTTTRQNLVFLRNAFCAGIQYYWHMIWGFPGDKIEDYQETLELIPLLRHLPAPIEMLHLKLIRFSSYLENPDKYQITNLRPLEVYYKIYPEWADVEKLAYDFIGDYPCEAHDNPQIIQAILDEIKHWQETWEQTDLVMLPYSGKFLIQDSRRIPDTLPNQVVNFERAVAIMHYSPFTDNQHQKWALQQKLGVVVDKWYVPLVTAPAELLLKFEEYTCQK